MGCSVRQERWRLRRLKAPDVGFQARKAMTGFDLTRVALIDVALSNGEREDVHLMPTAAALGQ
jgi:hypothetical protein